MTTPLLRMSRVVLAAVTLATTVLVGLSPPASAASSGWTSVTSGGDHTCGIRNGRVYCWGYDQFGQLGDGAAGGFRDTPAPIASGATDWTSVSAGFYHTCATRAGRVACWGRDTEGQLGDGTANAVADPTPGLIASGATDWKSLAAGGYHTCAIRVGRIACWGWDRYGELGDGSAADAGDPRPSFIQSGATDWTSVTAGAFHSCGLRVGRIACWGYDGQGQLGDGSAAAGADASPGLIASGATDWKSVSAGSSHTCATRAGRIACWGYDRYGQLGDGSASGTEAPDPTPGLIASGARDWTSVRSASNHTCALRAGRVACWGLDNYGQLGDGTAGGTDSTPGFIASGATDWKSVEGADGHTCAIRSTFLACWGADDVGQLGDGSAGDDPDPTPSLVL